MDEPKKNPTPRLFLDFPIYGNVMTAFLKATQIQETLGAAELLPSHVFLALCLNETCAFQHFVMDCSGIAFDIKDALDTLTSNESFYRDIYNDVFPFRNMNSDEDYDEATETSSDNETLEDDPETKDNMQEEESLDESLDNSEKSSSQKSGKTVLNLHTFDFFDFSVYYSDILIEILNTAVTACKSARISVLDANTLLYYIIKQGDEATIKLILNELAYIDDSDEAIFGGSFDTDFEACDSSNEDLQSDLYSVDSVLEFIETNYNIPQITSECPQTSLVLPSSLQAYCTCMNDKYDQKTVCDILGRDQEIQLVWNAMSKRDKRNVILVGQPGVGKTAIVEAIAMSIVHHTCPQQFQNFVVLELDLNSLVAGTQYRGQFEERLNKLLNFIKSKNNLIVFIDEIHNIIGCGSAEGTGDMSNVLKPVLARNDIIMIGSTTVNEYNNVIGSDGAFQRRFELVIVKEPTRKELLPMISKRIQMLSNYHGVSISKELVRKIVTYADVFKSSTCNPDRTIDLIDRSMAHAKNRSSKKVELSDIKFQFILNFTEFDKMPEETKIETAYHEVGHFVMIKVLQKLYSYSLSTVSIIPTEDFDGVNIYYYDPEAYILPDYYFYMAKCIVALGGRYSEMLKTCTVSYGAEGDLENVANAVYQIFAKCSLDKETSNVAYARFKELLTEDSKNELLKKCTDFINEASKYTERLINSLRVVIQKLVTQLLKNPISSNEELEKTFKKCVPEECINLFSNARTEDTFNSAVDTFCNLMEEKYRKK